MRKVPRVGILPLYIRLYDDRVPEHRSEFELFLQMVEKRLSLAGVEVVRAQVCREREEFVEAIRQLEQKNVHCLVTVHLAYSPSLESLDALLETQLPIIVLDTTMDASFDQTVEPGRIMYNHGVHGVMDLTAMLRRHGRPFEIVVGHLDEPGVLGRTVALARAAVAVQSFRGSRALKIGESFKSMGDVAVTPELLKERFGIAIDEVGLGPLAAKIERVSEEEIKEEMALDQEAFLCNLPMDVHSRSVRVGLGLKRLLDEGPYAAFSLSFLSFQDPDSPANTVPFLEISKAMARGVGYAGEGDMMTASFVGALSRGFGKTTFTEVFCPDWKGDSLFLTHMGEINPELAAERPVIVEQQFPFTEALNPAFLVCSLRPGPAVYVNLAPGPEESFSLLVAPVEVLADVTDERWSRTIRGWVRPACGVAHFLEANSRTGGTHHSALVLDQTPDALVAFGGFLGIDCHVFE
jgi:L-arabinose isomerase